MFPEFLKSDIELDLDVILLLCTIQVGDFGSAQCMHPSGTLEGLLVTPPYICTSCAVPGPFMYHTGMDMYALGLIMFETLACDPEFLRSTVEAMQSEHGLNPLMAYLQEMRQCPGTYACAHWSGMGRVLHSTPTVVTV
jgi:hypothetical protein